jgi:pre-mRNA-splicing helicase BRR2
LRGTSNVFISEFLSEIIETVIGDLSESRCCSVSSTDDEDGGGMIAPLNLGMIAAYYYVQYSTIELIAASVKAKSKIRDLLDILSQSYEFAALPVRYGEDKAMKIMSNRLRNKLPENALYDSNTKALILLQCHFSRTIVPSDMRDD